MSSKKQCWIDRQPGERVRLKGQRQALKVVVRTPHGILELVSIKERLKTDGGTLVIYPRVEKSITLPYFKEKIERRDFHFSVYPNIRKKEQCKVHLTIKGQEKESGEDASIDFMHKIFAPNGQFCFPMYGMIAPYLDNIQKIQIRERHRYLFLPSYQPNVCSLTFWVIVTANHDELEIPHGFSSRRLLFKSFSVHLVFSYIDCPSAFQTSFFAPPNDTMRLRFGEKEKMRHAIPPTIDVPINSYRAISAHEGFDTSTAASGISMALMIGASNHFSNAAEVYEREGVLIDGASPRAWFIEHGNDFYPNPVMRKHNLSHVSNNSVD